MATRCGNHRRLSSCVQAQFHPDFLRDGTRHDSRPISTATLSAAGNPRAAASRSHSRSIARDEGISFSSPSFSAATGPGSDSVFFSIRRLGIPRQPEGGVPPNAPTPTASGAPRAANSDPHSDCTPRRTSAVRWGIAHPETRRPGPPDSTPRRYRWDQRNSRKDKPATAP